METLKIKDKNAEISSIRKAAEMLWHLPGPFVSTQYSPKLWNRFRHKFIDEILKDAKVHFSRVLHDNITNLIRSLIAVQLFRMHDESMQLGGAGRLKARFSSDEISEKEMYRAMFQEGTEQYAAPFRHYVAMPEQDIEWMAKVLQNIIPMELHSETLEVDTRTSIEEIVNNAVDTVLNEWLNIKRMQGMELNEQNYVRIGFPNEPDERLYLLYKIRDMAYFDLSLFAMQYTICSLAENDEENREIHRLKTQIQLMTRDMEKEKKGLENELMMLRKEMTLHTDDAKDAEIRSLKAQVRKLSQELRHHEALQMRESEGGQEDFSTGPVNVAPVQQDEAEEDGTDYIDYSYRYLFPMVENMNVEPEIMKTFPNAKIVHSVNAEIPTGTQLIVMVTDIQSHSLYYKYKDKNYEMIHVPKSNMDVIKEKLNEYFRKKYNTKKEDNNL